MTTSNVYWMVEFTVDSEKKDDFNTFKTELIGAVQGEPGTLAYEWHEHEDGKTYYVFERYADSAAALTHFGGFGQFAERFMSLVSVTGFNAFGDINDELRTAIAGWNSPKWTQVAGFVR